MAGVNKTKNGNIVQPTKLNRLTGYSNTNRTKYNIGAYREVEKNMILAQNELDKAERNYIEASLTHTKLLSSAKSYEITRNSGKNVYDRMKKESQNKLFNLGKIYKAAEETFNKIKQKFNTFNHNFENSKKAPSSSWLPWRIGGRKTHKRKTNKRRHTKRNRN